MQKRENYLYVGMDLHKDTHTAVMVNCWNEKLDVIVIENKPSEFSKLAKRVNRMAVRMGLSPIYGLENAYSYGRSLAVWLIEKGYVVKDVNPSLAYDQRKSAPMMKKNDEYDAYCVATVLINQHNTWAENAYAAADGNPALFVTLHHLFFILSRAEIEVRSHLFKEFSSEVAGKVFDAFRRRAGAIGEDLADALERLYTEIAEGSLTDEEE